MQFIYYPRCSTCLKALKKLKEQGIDVTLRDIVNETPTQEELIKRPLLIDGEKIIIGYQKEIYEK